MQKIILASKSPRRRELLAQIGLEFTVITEEVEEFIPPGQLGEGVSQLAYQKAWAVANKLEQGIVIGADTVVIEDNHILGKPDSPEAAVAMLERLSGKSHQVITGVAVIDSSTGKIIRDWEQTKVFFRQLSKETITNYVNTGEPMDKAGAYGIQGKGSLLVTRIEGCYFNVVGLPLTKLAIILTEFGIKVL